MYSARSSRLGFGALALAGLLTLTACTDPGEDAPATIMSAADQATTSTTTSTPRWEEQLIDGPTKPEDLIQVSSGEIIISAMSADPGSADGGAGSLYAMDPVTGEMTGIWPHPDVGEAHDTARFAECPGPPDASVASPHGLGLEMAEDGTEYLYVVNHGSRESVEVRRGFRGPRVGRWHRVDLGGLLRPARGQFRQRGRSSPGRRRLLRH